MNDRFCEMLGYTQAELRGKTFLEITHPDDREASLTARRQLLAGEISSWSLEKRFIHKDGAIVWARLWISLVHGAAARLCGNVIARAPIHHVAGCPLHALAAPAFRNQKLDRCTSR
jgi:PAS domain S-box-containing protein